MKCRGDMWAEIHTELVPLWLEEVSRGFALLPTVVAL